MTRKLSLYERMVRNVDQFMKYSGRNKEELKRKYQGMYLAIDEEGNIIHDSDIRRLGRRIENRFIIYLGTIENIVNPTTFVGLGERL